MGRHKWFWIALSAWCFLGAAGAWAMFFSPAQLASQDLGQFTVQINGSQEINHVSEDFTTLELSAEAITKQWEAEGWHRLSRGFNLASILLGLPGGTEKALSPYLQFQAFQNQKKDTFRLLGLIRNLDGQGIYQWTAEIPLKALRSTDPSKIDFPFKPPSSASNVLSLVTEKVRVLAWKNLQDQGPETGLGPFFASQGFEERVLSQGSDETVLLLQRGATKLMAIVGHGGGNDMVSLVQLDGEAGQGLSGR